MTDDKTEQIEIKPQPPQWRPLATPVLDYFPDGWPYPNDWATLPARSKKELIAQHRLKSKSPKRGTPEGRPSRAPAAAPELDRPHAWDLADNTCVMCGVHRSSERGDKDCRKYGLMFRDDVALEEL